MSKAIDDLVALMPDARPGRVYDNVFDITVVIAEAGASEAAIATLRIYGREAIAYYVYDTYDDERIRITFNPGHIEPLLHYNKLRLAS